MPKILVKIIPILLFAIIFSYVLLNIPYPQSLTSATLFELLAFFIPLFLLLTFSLNLFFNFLPLAGVFSLGLIILLILEVLDSLNLVTASLTIISVGLFFSYFRRNRKRLTNWPKIPKLTRIKKEK